MDHISKLGTEVMRKVMDSEMWWKQWIRGPDVLRAMVEWSEDGVTWHTYALEVVCDLVPQGLGYAESDWGRE